jgi:hypothetical protein
MRTEDELHAVAYRCAAVLSSGDGEILWTSFAHATPTRARFKLPEDVGKVTALAATPGGVVIVDNTRSVWEWNADSQRWSELGAILPPDPPAPSTAPAPGSRGVLREPAPFDGPQPALIRCRSLRSFCVYRTVDAVAGDEIEISFERGWRLSRGDAPSVEVLDRAAFRKAAQAAERAAAADRG